MPTRVIREGILDSERIGKLSPLAELFYRKLMSVVDDYGRFEYVPSVLRARLYSQRLDSFTAQDIESWMRECADGDLPLVITYEHNGKRYLEIQEFNQQLKAKESKYPTPTSVYGRIRMDTGVYSRASPTPSSPSPSLTSSLFSQEEGCGEKPSSFPIPVADKANPRVVEMRRQPPKAEDLPVRMPAVVNGAAAASFWPPLACPAPDLSAVPASKPDAGLDVWCEAEYAIHPKKTDKFEAMTLLVERFRHDELARSRFSKRHAEWIDYWRRERTKLHYIPKLKNFIVDDTWTDAPPSVEDCDDNAGIVEVPEL